MTLEPRTALAYERSELVRDESAARVAALAAWRRADGPARVLVTGVQALFQHTLAPDAMPRSRPVRLGRASGSTRRASRTLVDLGYEAVPEVAGRGEFARRGGIVDVFPAGQPLPVRIEWFGDEIESLRAFDPADQRGVGALEETALLPASEFLLGADAGASCASLSARPLASCPADLAADLARLEQGQLGDAAEIWAGHLAPATALDHLGDAIWLLDEPGDVAAAADFLWAQADERRAELEKAGELPKGWPGAYPEPREWKRRLNEARTLELTWESEADGAPPGGNPFGWHEPVLPPVPIGDLAATVARWRREGRARRPGVGPVGAPVGAPGRRRHRGRARESPRRGTAAGRPGADRSQPQHRLRRRPGRPGAGHRPRAVRHRCASAGRGPSAASCRATCWSGSSRATSSSTSTTASRATPAWSGAPPAATAPRSATSWSCISPARTASGSRSSRSTASRATPAARNPQLSRLGGGEWQRTKSRVRKAVGDLAKELLELYSSRARARGRAFGDDTPWQPEMEAAFPYEETPDQLRAAIEVKADLEREQPMDRLVVGDVGYGKTEVALRAAFKAIQEGMQVAVLVPTTVLAAQHLATFSQRFAAYPITVRMLSRFVSARSRRTRWPVSRPGPWTVVIGTHRLLSKDVHFKDLGLVVVDEEQRFGVAHKERLKQLQDRGPRADAVGHAHPADAEPGARRASAT